MATALSAERKPASVAVKIFAFFIGLLFLFGTVVMLFHFFYERHYRTQSLNHALAQNIFFVHNYLQKHPIDSIGSLTALLTGDMRITIIGLSGEVWYDNYIPLNQLDNHLQRPEIQEAAQKGSGSYIRSSPTNQVKYYYFAERFDTCFIRAALPYNTNASRLIAPNYLFFVFTVSLLCLLAMIMFMVWSRMGKHLTGTQLEQERYIRQELTQNLSHELKTPVSSILGYMETLVLKPDLAPEKVRFFIERCYVQTQRLGRLIEDISLLNRLDHAPDRFPFEPTDVYEIIENVVKDLNLQLSERQITVDFPPQQPLTIRGNYALLYSVFRNLFDNAIAYAGTNITLSIAWRDKGDSYLYFSFEDDGPGVGLEHLPHLFDRFYRIDSGRSRKLGGTGLGLSIVKNGVAAHGGSIEVTTAEGKGLTFLFKLKK